jgi:tetratricopeptide (TPR) repeat protein
MGRGRLLVGCLLLLAILYVALLPRLRRMAADTARLQRDTAARQAAAARLAGLRQALDAARTQAASHPDSAPAQLELAMRLSETGQLDEAARHARVAARLQPHDPEPLLLLADIEHRARRYDAAVDAYKAALAIAPGNQRALTGLAFLYVAFGWPFDAEALLQPAVRAAPQNTYLKVALAAAYTQQQNWDAAERLLLEARHLAPDEVTLWSPLAHLYNQTHRERDAVAVAREALARRPGDTQMLNELGEAYYQLHDLPNAMAAFRQTVAVQPDDVTAHYDLGLCYQRLNQPEEAIRELEDVRRRDADFAQTRLLLGRLYLRDGRAAEGRRLLDESRRVEAREHRQARAGLLVSIHPRSAAAHWQMALIYREQGNRGRMIVEARKVLELDPHHAAARRMLGAPRG